MATVSELIERCEGAMEDANLVFGHGTDNAWDEATTLVLSVANLADDRSSLGVRLSREVEEQVEALLMRRINERVPLPYLLGKAWFAGHEFLLAPGVVVPRSPIGELIGHRFQPWLIEPPRTVLDLCTGSGCIGIAIAHEFPEARVTLVELDPEAAALARRNVELHELTTRVAVLEGDLYEPLAQADGPTVEERFDLIVSNPPYVDAPDMSSLPEEFRHESVRGLAGGADGLDVVRRILEGAGRFLTPSGLLVCEVGMSAPALQRAYPDLPFIWPEFEAGGEGVFLLAAGIDP
jgi:ribosomal protein L3 glutamine methyltransferase